MDSGAFAEAIQKGLGNISTTDLTEMRTAMTQMAQAVETFKVKAAERASHEAEAKMEDSTPYLSEAFTADDMYKAIVSGGRLENRPAMAWKPMDKI